MISVEYKIVCNLPHVYMLSTDKSFVSRVDHYQPEPTERYIMSKSTSVKNFVAEQSEYHRKGGLSDLAQWRLGKAKPGDHLIYACKHDADADTFIEAARDMFFKQIGAVIKMNGKQGHLTPERFTQGIRHQIKSWCGDDQATKDYHTDDLPMPRNVRAWYKEFTAKKSVKKTTTKKTVKKKTPVKKAAKKKK